MNKQEPLNEELVPYICNDLIPMIKHPFIYIIPYTGGAEHFIINETYKFKVESLEKAEAERDFYKYVFLHEKPYRLKAFIDIQDELTDDEYWVLLGEIYTNIENTYEYKKELKALFNSKRKNRFKIMSENEFECFEKFPEILTIYRGCTERNLKGYSWTLNKDKAIWFAKRFKSNKPILLTQKINRDKTIAYFNRRNEYEIITKEFYGKNSNGVVCEVLK